jgi:hypothetical protein
MAENDERMRAAIDKKATQNKVGVTGTEHIADFTANQAVLRGGAADSGAVLTDSMRLDPMLATVVAIWPRLTALEREAIMAIVDANVGPLEDK